MTRDLATRWLGLRFRAPETEREFSAWYAEHSLTYLRLGLGASTAGWLLSYCLLSAVVPGFSLRSLPWIGSMIVLLVVAFVIMLRRPSLAAGAACVANAVAGLTALGLATVEYQTSDATAVVVLVLFFGFTIFRLRPLRALMAVSTYLIANELVLIDHYRSNVVDSLQFWTATSVAATALTTGLIACAFLERDMRLRFRDERVIIEQGRTIAHERERSDALLLNVLPGKIAERLKTSPGVIADRLDDVTIMFADVVGFTPLSAAMQPEEVVSLLNEVFSTFDRLAGELGVEKIKTIGDAYMAVGGLPEPREDHAEAIADLALGMQSAMKDIAAGAGHLVDLRIGISSGPAVAGVIGLHKFAYDLWGDTVNVAARMESHGVPGSIQVSEATYGRLRDRYELVERGEVELKGRGTVKTWFLVGRLANVDAAALSSP